MPAVSVNLPLSRSHEAVLATVGAAMLLAPVPLAFWMNGRPVLTAEFALWAGPTIVLAVFAGALAAAGARRGDQVG